MDAWNFILFFSLIVSFILILSVVNLENPTNKKVDFTIDYPRYDQKPTLEEMSLHDKIAQMIIIRGDTFNSEFLDIGVGGIFLDEQKTDTKYSELIQKYQEDSRIKLFVTTDLEGAWNPFSEHEFLYFSDVLTPSEAYEVGSGHAKILRDLGFNFNFAPVSEFNDDVYGGRAFTGSKNEIKEKLKEYIKGLKDGGIMGTCKHYPGRAMEKNLHLVSDSVEILKDDLELFDVCIENHIEAVMVSHQIVSGEVNSRGQPSVVSSEVISHLPSDVLVISDEINMRGLSKFYSNKNKLYVDLINAGNNVILDFKIKPSEIEELISYLENAVQQGELNEEMIDSSVKKILKAKQLLVEKDFHQ